MRVHFWIVLIGMVAPLGVGCATVSPEQQARQERERWCKQSESRHVEVFLGDMTPSRPYRVLGPVQARFDVSDEGRFRTLRVHACQMGADAIINASIEVIPLVNRKTVTESDDDGNTRQIVIEEPAGSRSLGNAIAVVYADRPTAAPRPRESKESKTSW